jgi:hypothetical protein
VIDICEEMEQRIGRNNQNENKEKDKEKDILSAFREAGRIEPPHSRGLSQKHK